MLPTTVVAIDDQTAQRSMVRRLKITLNIEPASITPAAFVVTTAAGVVVPTQITGVQSGIGQVIVTLGFTGVNLPDNSVGDGGVTIVDFNAVSPAFGKTQGQAGYGDGFDYDDNGISIVDFNEFVTRCGRSV